MDFCLQFLEDIYVIENTLRYIPVTGCLKNRSNLSPICTLMSVLAKKKHNEKGFNSE